MQPLQTAITLCNLDTLDIHFGINESPADQPRLSLCLKVNNDVSTFYISLHSGIFIAPFMAVTE